MAAALVRRQRQHRPVLPPSQRTRRGGPMRGSRTSTLCPHRHPHQNLRGAQSATATAVSCSSAVSSSVKPGQRQGVASVRKTHAATRVCFVNRHGRYRNKKETKTIHTSCCLFFGVSVCVRACVCMCVRLCVRVLFCCLFLLCARVCRRRAMQGIVALHARIIRTMIMATAHDAPTEFSICNAGNISRRWHCPRRLRARIRQTRQKQTRGKALQQCSKPPGGW